MAGQHAEDSQTSHLAFWRHVRTLKLSEEVLFFEGRDFRDSTLEDVQDKGRYVSTFVESNLFFDRGTPLSPLMVGEGSEQRLL